MKALALVLVCLCVVPLCAWSAEPPTEFDKNWPQWRGPFANGVAPHANPPLEWSEDENIRWKITLPGKGHATPIVWEDHVYVLSAIETDKKGEPSQETQTESSQSGNRGRSRPGGRGGRGGWRPPSATTTNIHQFAIMAIKRSNGEIAWKQIAREEMPHEGTHATASWASNSPVTDGERIYAYFGSRGLFCYDMQGHLLWESDLGDMNVKLAFGEGSSPVLYGDRLIVVWDHEGQSFIVALDKKTGKELWRVDREEKTSWATPLVVEQNGKPQIITSATSRVRSYDLATGELLWESSGMTANAIPSPVATNEMVYVMSGFRGNALLAIRLKAAKGDITGSDAIAWALDRDTPYTPSPLLYQDRLYFLKSNDGIVASFNAKTGEEYFGRQRLQGIEGVYASPVAAHDRVYIVGRNGTTAVLKHAADFQVLATNTLDATIDASPAVVGNELFLRGHDILYCVARN